MLRPIPRQLLYDTLTLKVCTGMDAWQHPEWLEHTVLNVHLQDTNEVKKSADNTEVVLRSVLFIDCALSRPALDYSALAAQSQANGKPLRAVVQRGENILGDFEVLTVDGLPDVPANRVHHWELGLV